MKASSLVATALACLLITTACSGDSLTSPSEDGYGTVDGVSGTWTWGEVRMTLTQSSSCGRVSGAWIYRRAYVTVGGGVTSACNYGSNVTFSLRDTPTLLGCSMTITVTKVSPSRMEGTVSIDQCLGLSNGHIVLTRM